MEATVLTKDKAPDATTNKKKCCVGYKSWKSVKSAYCVLSICGFMSIMSISSAFSVLSINSAFSVASGGSLASVASANSVFSIGSLKSAFSIGSMNCYGCIFNVPITGHMNTCDKSRLTKDDKKELQDALYGRAYETFRPSIKDLSEEDLVNDCCLHIHSSEATKHGLQSFITNSNRTACLMFGGNGTTVIDKVDVDAAQNIYRPTS